jgi:hypothetical protein
MPLDFEFRARIWLFAGGNWYFVTLPKGISAEIHARAGGRSKPGGSLRVTAMIGATRWKTSIFRDRKREAYVLPIKAAVRSKEQLRDGDSVEVTLLAEYEFDAGD